MTERAEIRRIFRRFYGSARWAASKLDVKESTVSRWLRGTRSGERLNAEMPRLAAEIKDTNGACIGRKVNGPSVRLKVGRLRRKPKGGSK